MVVRRRTATSARTAYAAVIVLATLSNLHFDPDTAALGFRLGRALRLTVSLHDAVDAVRNLALFAGLGVVWVVTSSSDNGWRGARHATLLGMISSVLVETLQLFSPVRYASLIDVVTDTVGTFCGALVVVALISGVRALRDRESFVGVPASLFAGAYGSAVLTEAFAPLLRKDLLPNLGGGISDRIGRAWVAMRPVSVFEVPVLDVALFAPAGAFAVAALLELGVSGGPAWWGVALGGSLVCTVIEVVHGVIRQPIHLGAAAAHGGGIALGAWAAARGLPAVSARLDDRRRSRALCILYALLVMLWSWRPFVPELNAASMREQFTAVHWIPLRAMAGRIDVFGVTDVVTQFLLFLPLGALLAVWPLRTRGPWRHLLPALYLSALCEVGKIVVAERFLDVTHVLVQIAGAGIGWAVVRRGGFRIRGQAWALDGPDRGSPPLPVAPAS